AGRADGIWPGACRPARYLPPPAQAPDAAVRSAGGGGDDVFRPAGARVDSLSAGMYRGCGIYHHRHRRDVPLDAQARGKARTMSASGPALWAHLADTPLFWLGFTLAAYLVAVIIYQRCGGNPLLLPVLSAVILVIAFLYATRTPYAVYARHTWFL